VAVIVDDNLAGSERAVAQAFLDYLMSDEGQSALSHYYLRSTETSLEALPPLGQSFTVEELGGWSQIYPHLIEMLWQEEIEPRLELETVPKLLPDEE
jgi:ABC-type sulfate transport system substrate-binding protein